MFSLGFPWFRAPPALILRPCGSAVTVSVFDSGRTIVVLSKALKDNIKSLINENSISFYRISALDSDLVSGLKELISKNLKLSSQSNIIITNSRHLEALNNSLKAIESVNKGLKEGVSGDLLSIDLNDAIINISIITGKIDIDQDILGSIFSKFCIGK